MVKVTGSVTMGSTPGAVMPGTSLISSASSAKADTPSSIDSASTRAVSFFIDREPPYFYIAAPGTRRARHIKFLTAYAAWLRSQYAWAMSSQSCKPAASRLAR